MATALGASVLIAMFAVMLPRVVWTAFDTYVLDNPDYKLGADGGLMIVTFLGAACGLVAGIAIVMFAAIAVAFRHELDRRVLLYSALLSGLLLSWPSYYVPRLPGWGYETALAEFGGMAANWALICLPVIAVSYFVVRAICRLTAASTPTRAETARAGDAGR
jgi:hypothetical protein